MFFYINLVKSERSIWAYKLSLPEVGPFNGTTPGRAVTIDHTELAHSKAIVCPCVICSGAGAYKEKQYKKNGNVFWKYSVMDLNILDIQNFEIVGPDKT